MSDYQKSRKKKLALRKKIQRFCLLIVIGVLVFVIGRIARFSYLQWETARDFRMILNAMEKFDAEHGRLPQTGYISDKNDPSRKASKRSWRYQIYDYLDLPNKREFDPGTEQIEHFN